MKQWFQTGILIMAVGFVTVYLSDWVVFKMRGSPQSTITVQRYLTVPLKGNKQEFDYLGATEVPCSVSMFSQGGHSPCWQLRRNPTENTKL